MEPTPNNDEPEKLISEWRASADDQIIWAGLAVILAFVAFLGWNQWRGDDSEITLAVPEITQTTTVETDETTATTIVAPNTTVSAAIIPAAIVNDDVEEFGDVNAAVSGLAGTLTGRNVGAKAIVTGFVANTAEKTIVRSRAAAVAGITSVDVTGVKILEPSVNTALTASQVLSPRATGVGTVLTVSGTVNSDEGRQQALTAAAAVEGVTQVVDKLELSVAANLNLLPKVQFATGSANILPVSFGDLDAAAETIKPVQQNIKLRVEGYTDKRGDAARNQQLSQARAEAVRTYLINAGVAEPTLIAEGFGPTEQFQAGDTPDALEANRVVRFIEFQ